MSITTLSGFRAVNQLSAATTDHQLDENARLNCVPSSICAALDFLTGKTFEPDQIKDDVYGQGWTGFQAARDYVGYCHDQGVDLHPVKGSPAQLVSIIHSEVAAGHPVLVTMPSQWGTPLSQQKSGYTTHVGVMCGTGPGQLRCMNPWGGFWQDQDDSWWAARLCDGEVWPMIGGAVYTAVKGPDGSTWYEDPRTRNRVGGGIYRKYVMTHGYPACIKGEHDAPGAYGARGDKVAYFGDPKGDDAEDKPAYWEAKSGNVTDGWGSHLLMVAESVVADLTKQLADAKAAQPAPATTESAPAPSKADELVSAIKAAIAA